MTAQTREIVIIGGKPEPITDHPLEPWLEASGIDRQAWYEAAPTNLHRGYLGVWEIADESLFLIGLFDGHNRPMQCDAVFGPRTLPILADWFSGRLGVPRGEYLDRWHFGGGGMTSQCLRLYLNRGKITGRRVYDQRKLLRRRYAAWHSAPESAESGLAVDTSHIGALGGLTDAGLQVLGLAPDAGIETWEGGRADEYLDEWATPLIAQCARPHDRPPPG